jgi:transposase InsO family protein
LATATASPRHSEEREKDQVRDFARNGICERFHKTVLNEFYRVAFRKKVYRSIEELQADLDSWITEYNEARPHQGRWCLGKTPMQTFLDAIPMTKEKMIAA